MTKKIELRPIGAEYNDAMLAILAERPMDTGAMAIHFDRSPDVLVLPKLHYDRFKYGGFFHGDELMGIALIGFHRGYVNGKPETIFTVTDFYILRSIYEFISKETDSPLIFREAAQFLYEDLGEGCDLGYYVIMEGNKAAESYVGKRPTDCSHTPFTRTIARQEVAVILVGPRGRPQGRYAVRQARMEDVDRIVAFLDADFRDRLFGPVITREGFLEALERRPDFGIENYVLAECGKELVGACAYWDTGRFKRSRVVRYGLGLRLTRFLFNLGSRLWGVSPMPAVGEAFRELHVTEYAARDRDPAIMEAMLGLVYDQARHEGYNLVNFCSAMDDPLLQGTRGFWSERVPSHIVLASKKEERLREGEVRVRLPYVDVALL